MKPLKRVLALITALVLCLAPMMLMVGAAEVSVYGLNVNTCDCNNPGQPWGGKNPEFQYYVYDAYWCKSMYYTGGYFTCLTCGETQAIDGYNVLIAHPTFTINPANGRYWCPECHYQP